MLNINLKNNALFCTLIFALSTLSIAKNCHIHNNNIYTSDLINLNCKQLILPKINAKKGESINLACVIIDDTHKGYDSDPDAMQLIGDVSVIIAISQKHPNRARLSGVIAAEF